MGKKARKTRWRTLSVADEHSDSEESNTAATPRLPNAYQPKSYYNKFPYSSQSTPRRRYQHDGLKSTRSSSTASETKITFNEDEYTRITTPRQDVLFKKGYLSKPKNYQTQTSTGTSTNSTGNSTGNGTPDHQSTDLEYESQFVFPNGFVDQNGIYYVNSYESYPLMLYNPPTYYPEFSNCKLKRYSIGSLTESTSPNNEEATSQDLSGGEASNNVSDYSGHHQVYNMVYPGYYVNEVCPAQDDATGQCSPDQSRRIKKRRRRRTSQRSQTTSQDSSDLDGDSCQEQETDSSNVKTPPVSTNVPATEEEINDSTDAKDETSEIVTNPPRGVIEINNECNVPQDSSSPDNVPENTEKDESTTEETTKNPLTKEKPSSDCQIPPKYDLKPDAEEFIPRAYRNTDIPMSPVQFIKMPPNFVPIPVPIPFNGQNFNPAFISSGIPINFVPPDPNMFPNYVGFVQSVPYLPKNETEVQEITQDTVDNHSKEIDTYSAPKNDHTVKNKEPTEKFVTNNKSIDIATVVSKLEEAVKEQEEMKTNRATRNDEEVTNSSPRRNEFNYNKQFRTNQRYKNNFNYRRNYCKTPQNSPQRQNNYQHEDISVQNVEKSIVPEDDNENKYDVPYDKKFSRNSPEKFRKIWKQPYQNGAPKWHQNGVHKSPKSPKFESKERLSRTFAENKGTDKENKHIIKNYSETLKNMAPSTKTVEQKSEVHRNAENKFHKVTNDRLTITPKTESSSPNVQSPSHTLPNQWISVSSRKKRKNKNVEESDTSLEENHSQNDLFECYDVNLLVDVIPQSETIEVAEIESAEAKLEEIITIIAQNESINIENNRLTPDIPTVTDIESKLLVKSEPEQTEEVPEVLSVQQNITEVPKVTTEPEEIQLLKPLYEDPVELTVSTESTSKNRKKTKKTPPKPLVKRVIITDIDLSEKCEEIKSPKIEKKLEVPEKKPIKLSLDEVEPDIKCERIPGESLTSSEEEEKKKTKKKKKKPSKAAVSNTSLASSSTTLNLDESYDFLLDSALAGESEDKTNDEISQELDKIIQKGIFSSLEGNIRSLNIDESDGFFKSVFSKISGRESSVEKAGYAKTPDFSKVLQNTRTLFKPCSVSEELNFQNKKANQMLPDLDSPLEDGLFLENPDMNGILEDWTATKDQEPGHELTQTTTEEIKSVKTDEQKISYPITEAVKEWMHKTREATPDVEILKSPSTIFKEFCESATTETEVGACKNFSGGTEDDEIEIFTKSTGLKSGVVIDEQQDLLEYWEDDFKSNKLTEKCSGQESEAVEQGEDVVEVYESKYGTNEDYINLQKEIKEKIKQSESSFRKRSNLPYKAICCNIM